MKDVAVVSHCRTGIARAVRGALDLTHGNPLCAAGGITTAVSLERA